MTGGGSTPVAPPATGSEPAIDHLVRCIQDGREPIRAGVQGTGGSGKSVFLRRLACRLRGDGHPVTRDLGGAAGRDMGPTRPVVLIDDAHQLDEHDLARLHGLLCRDDVHVVVAFRPWPRCSAMARLISHLDAERPVIVLRPLSTAGVRDYGASVLGGPVSFDRAAKVLDLTGGNPRLVDLVLTSMRDDGWDPDSGALPASMLEVLHHEFDALHPGLHEIILAMAVGYSRYGPAFSTAPRFVAADTRTLMVAARASGLLSPDGTLVPVVREALLESAPRHALWSLRRELVDALEAAELPLDEIALDLARQGYRDSRVERELRARADRLLATDPGAALDMYEAMIDVGVDESAVAGGMAQAAWAVGDWPAAERVVDRALGRGEPDDVHRVAGVAAAAWARNGMINRSADFYLKLTATDAAFAPLAAVCLAGTGDVAEARRVLAQAPNSEFPTWSQVGLRLMADGILAAVGDASDQALSWLLQASSALDAAGEVLALPEAPAVLAAQVALNIGELGIANEVLGSAVDAGQGGVAFRRRLLLMQSLVSLRANCPIRARELLSAAEAVEQPRGHRDAVLAHAVHIGLARRTDDIAGLARNWAAARQSIARMGVDLFMLPALAELAVAAARLHATEVVEAHVARGWDVLESAGRPSCWMVSFHWAAIEAAILLEDADGVERHASALIEVAPQSQVAGRLANAGRTWAAALAGQVVVASVTRAVRDLAASGYLWDASRLAGHAAARAPEHADTLQLLALARGIHPHERDADAPRGAVEPRGVDQRDAGVLTGRERQVARLVLEGKTYAEIGHAVFISPRTAEHHIARIRRRLGVSSRSELLTQLRIALDEGGPGR